MRSSTFALLAFAIVMPAFAGLYACGSSSGDDNGNGGDGGQLYGPDGAPLTFQDAGFTAPDCPGCTFPGNNAPACPSGTPAIDLVYPNDDTLVPPNMNVISVQWTPFGAAFKEFEVDFENSITDMRVITKCAVQTVDTEQPPQPSGGCELLLDQQMWDFVAQHNRGQPPVTITVRGTTDGTCANTSTNSVRLAFAEEDILGAIYYWKSTVSANGVGGQIWQKSFGDSNPETKVTLTATCNGCHSLSRDGVRMTVNSDDDDSDDEYGDMCASLIDMTNLSIIPQTAVCPQATRIGGAMKPGFGTFSPDHSGLVMSNGLGAVSPPTNVFFQLNGGSGATGADVTVAGQGFVTMPDWSPDGKNLVFVVPQAVGSWDGSGRNDDDHVFGGSIFTMPYNGGQQFGAASALITSGGENNYYPSYSPDGQFLIFDRAPANGSVNPATGCTGTPPQVSCPNDSFSNPAARVMLQQLKQGGTTIDLEKANGSNASSPLALSNSWPKWSPFLQTQNGGKLLWIAFSSTRDYGLRVRNHMPGMFQCYPADSYQDPGAAHRQPFLPTCQQPQLWMAAVNVSSAEVSNTDPSRPAFWLPFQDMKTHNHTPQWTQKVASPQPDAGACYPVGGNCQANPAACCNGSACSANGTCQSIIH
jgi:hypothetical protein